MVRNTGPGKVTDNTDKTPRSALTGLLFNFDVEGDTVKPEHESWLVSNVIPLLACDQAVGSLQGLASRSGSAYFNMQLSQKRVENVKRLLAARGASPAKLNALWSGEEPAALAGEIDGTEDERYRAVGVSVKLPARPTEPFFNRENPGEFEDGFDPEVNPSWLMVPTFGVKQLVFMYGAGVRLVTTKPSKVQFIDPVSLRRVNELVVTSNRQVIQFFGNMPGEAVVMGTDLVTGKVSRMLDVEVMQPRHVKLAFHFVTDPQHPTPQRPVGTIHDMLKDARRVYKDQANVILDVVSEVPDTLKFVQNLGNPTFLVRGKPAVTPSMVGGKGFPILANRGNPTARVNIFLVWEWQSLPEDVNGEADDIPGKSVVLEDDTSSAEGKHEGYTLGHELGHCLGLDHRDKDDGGNKFGLMWPFTNQHQGQLSRDEVRKVRANLL